MSDIPDRPESGFTLVEVIITLLVAVILAGIMVQYLGTAVSRSDTPLNRLGDDAALQAVADTIIGAFRQARPGDAGAWNAFQAGLGLPGTLQNNAYGRYRVIFNDYIQFDADGNETADVLGTAPENMLKIVLAGEGEATLTFLLIR